MSLNQALQYSLNKKQELFAQAISEALARNKEISAYDFETRSQDIFELLQKDISNAKQEIENDLNIHNPKI